MVTDGLYWDLSWEITMIYKPNDLVCQGSGSDYTYDSIFEETECNLIDGEVYKVTCRDDSSYSWGWSGAYL